MQRHSLMHVTLGLLLAGSPLFAQAPASNPPREPVTPTTILERPETRIVRVEIQPRSTRSAHSHPDAQFHIFIPLTGPLDMNIEGEKPLHLEPWQAHFFKGGTTHAFTNNSASVVQFLEVFVQKSPASAELTADQILAAAATATATAAGPAPLLR